MCVSFHVSLRELCELRILRRGDEGRDCARAGIARPCGCGIVGAGRRRVKGKGNGAGGGLGRSTTGLQFFLWKRAVVSGWRPRRIGLPLFLLRVHRNEHDILVLVLLLLPVRLHRLLLPILPLAPALPFAHPPPLPPQERP